MYMTQAEWYSIFAQSAKTNKLVRGVFAILYGQGELNLLKIVCREQKLIHVGRGVFKKM